MKLASEDVSVDLFEAEQPIMRRAPCALFLLIKLARALGHGHVLIFGMPAIRYIAGCKRAHKEQAVRVLASQNISVGFLKG